MSDVDQDAYAPSPDGRSESSESNSGGEAQGWFANELPDNQYAALARTIEHEIIPRLLRAHRFESPQQIDDRPARSSDAVQSVIDFAALISAGNSFAIHDHVAGLFAKGIGLDAVLLDLLAPTARYFGDLWCEDECSFMDVTLALCKLQQLLREFGESNQTLPDQQKYEHAILLASVPTNQHSFGVLMLEGFFRRAGWNARTLPMPSAGEIIDAVRNDHYAVVGLSMSCDGYAAKLPALIATLRRVSRNRSLVVLAGGPYFIDQPEKAVALGADGTACDAVHAVAQTERVLKAINRN